MVDVRHYLQAVRAARPVTRPGLWSAPSTRPQLLVVVLMGARQTGKSTLARTEPFLADRLYLSLDDPETQEKPRLGKGLPQQGHGHAWLRGTWSEARRG